MVKFFTVLFLTLLFGALVFREVSEAEKCIKRWSLSHYQATYIPFCGCLVEFKPGEWVKEKDFSQAVSDEHTRRMSK